jgi:hypothetical protein
MSEDNTYPLVEKGDITYAVESLVGQLLDDGARPSDISFVLSMVSTELGLKVTNKNISVFAVVLEGVTEGVKKIFRDEIKEREAMDAISDENRNIH